jgi:hypothetical protein
MTETRGGKSALYVGQAMSGKTTRLIEAIDSAVPPGGRGLLLSRTRLQRAVLAARLYDHDPSLPKRILCGCTASVVKLLTGGVYSPPGSTATAFETAWRSLRADSLTDLNAAAASIGLTRGALVPEPKLPAGVGATARFSIPPGSTEALGSLLMAFDVVALDCLEYASSSVAEVLEFVTTAGGTVLATFDPDQEVPSSDRSIPPVRDLVPSLMEGLLESGPSRQPAGIVRVRQALARSTPVEDGTGRWVIDTPAALDAAPDGVTLLCFPDAGSARDLVTQALAHRFPVPGSTRWERACPDDGVEELSRLFGETEGTLCVIVAAFGEMDPLRRAARQNHVAADFAEPSRFEIGDLKTELYKRFLYGGVIPVSRKALERSPVVLADELAAMVRLYATYDRKVDRRSETWRTETDAVAEVIRADPSLQTGVHRGHLLPEELEVGAERVLEIGVVGRRVAEMMRQLATFERERSDARVRAKWLGHRVEHQVPRGDPDRQRVRASPVSQYVMTDAGCRRDARLAAWDLHRRERIRDALPLVSVPGRVLVVSGGHCRAVQADTIVVWGVGDNELGTASAGSESLTRSRARMVGFYGRARSRVFVVSWSPAESGLLRPSWFGITE